MPIKFPKFSRRKSAGNTLDAAYEPASTGSPLRPGFENYSHNSGAAGINPYGGYSGQPYNNNNTPNHRWVPIPHDVQTIL